MLNPAKYAFPIPGDETNWNMPRGYSVSDVCGGCSRYIDRGIDHMCFKCTYYFCLDHLTEAYSKDGEIVSIFVNEEVGERTQVCAPCRDTIEGRPKEPDTETDDYY